MNAWRSGALVAFIALCLTAQALPTPAWGAWTKETVLRPENHSIVGEFGLAFSPTGGVGMSFATGEFRYLYASRGLAGWTLEDIPNGGAYSSLAFDSEARPHVVSSGQGGQNIKHSVRDVDGWTTTGMGIFGLRPRLALDGEDVPHISYEPQDRTGYATYDTLTGSWISEIVDPRSTTNTDIAVDSQGVPHIAFGVVSGNLQYASKTSSGWVIEQVTTGCNWDIALAIDAQDRPHVSCGKAPSTGNGGGLGYATKVNGVWTFEIADGQAGGILPQSGMYVGYYTDIAVTPAGVPHISYFVVTCCQDAKEHLHYATKTGGSWKVEIPDRTSGNNGWESAIAVDADGYPHIVYSAFPELGTTDPCNCGEVRYVAPAFALAPLGS